jgi:hypothetical protein
MKTLTTFLCLLLFAGQVFPQRRPENQLPLIITPTPHDPNFKSRLKSTDTKSFYKSKADWQLIIDTIWGPGLPLNEKLSIFDNFTHWLTGAFDGFNTLGIDKTEWNAITSAYRSRINESTSEGAFASLYGHLAYSLYDVHTYAFDTVVTFAPLNPGTPLLVIGAGEQSHFGAVLTLSADSTILVLRALKNHPLDLQPGDRILGYEGIAWKALVDELLDSDIPIYSYHCGAKSASRHFELMSAGMNWHLFDTIDIVKYASGDTVHLPVSRLLDLPVPTGSIWSGGENLMWNNEQLPVPGVPIPDAEQLCKKGVTYGKVEGTNIGYIYLYVEAIAGMFGLPYNSDKQFYEAVSALMETEGLIIDLRINYGGGAYYADAEALLFNQNLRTMDGAYRCNKNENDFTLCPVKDYEAYRITGNPNSLYDRPMAVLIGPNCASMGDLTAYLLDYHPMAHFFGKATCGSLGDNGGEILSGWIFNSSYGDIFHVNDPGTYLNRREFPVDVPVWFNADDVANGVDPVVKAAMEWINNLSYAHDVSAKPRILVPGNDTVTITAQVENPNNHSISVIAHIASMDSLMTDTMAFFDDGIHNDGDPGDGTWGAMWPVPSGDETYAVSVSTEDTTAGSLRTLPNVVRFTTIGPVNYEDYSFSSADTVFNPGDKDLKIKLILKNNGSTGTVKNVSAKLTSTDTLIIISSTSQSFGDINPGESSISIGKYNIRISEKCPNNTQIPIKVEISSDGYNFWSDIFSIIVQEPVGIEEIMEPITRIYPNPTENILNIELNDADNQPLEIEIFTITGEVIYQKNYKNIAAHFVEQVDLSDYAKGIYLVKVKQNKTVTVGKVVVR